MTFINPLAPKNRNVPAKAAQIKAWVRVRFGLDETTVISIAELTCQDDGCPDVETVIGIMRKGAAIETLRVHKMVREIEWTDISDL